MKTKYERSWDSYSKEWDSKPLPGGMLGSEWGDESLTARVFESFLAPNLGPDTRVLEIGPGGGKYSVRTAPRCKQLVCADVSQRMLGRTRERLRDHDHVGMLKLNGIDFEGVADGAMDFVYSIDVFVHLDLEDVYVYLREIRRILRDGGRAVVHFANILSAQGWALFVREADVNRADFKQIGRINFVTPETIVRLSQQLRFVVERVDGEISPRDFFVVLRKPELTDDPGSDARRRRILARSGGGAIERDFLHELPAATIAAPDERYISGVELEIGGDRRDFLFQHPPSLVGWSLTVPRRASFISAVGVDPRVASRCCEDGIEFEVRLRQGTEEQSLFSKRLDPRRRPADVAWHEVRLDLSRFAGKVAFLLLETRIDRNLNEFNWCGWGEPAVVTGIGDATPEPSRRET